MPLYLKGLDEISVDHYVNDLFDKLKTIFNYTFEKFPDGANKPNGVITSKK